MSLDTPNPGVDAYLAKGCGRCPLGDTPDCKVHPFREELEALRTILRETALTEKLKWGVPCYTWNQKNVVILSALKEAVVLGFFKGVLLQDGEKVLIKPGPNSQSDRQLRFTKVSQILEQEDLIKAYAAEAIEIEKKGLKVVFEANPEPVPEELAKKMEVDPAFKAAFQALTPGRQRGYVLYFSGAKKPETRINRIEKKTPRIMEGKGMQDQ